MSEFSFARTPPASREMSCKAAIVGIGETDYHDDYKAQRARAPGYQAPEVEELATRAFERAIADAGIDRKDIDGLACSFTYGGPPPDAMANLLGLSPRYSIANGNIMAGPLPAVCAAIAEGKADTVAMVYSVASRAIGREYGGATYGSGEGAPTSYYYYHPWGWSSQAAHWAMMFNYFANRYGATERDLGAVAKQVRDHAALNPNAVMQKPITIDDYMASRYIVRPFHLFDLCLVNDGAVCLIVTKDDIAKAMDNVPVHVAGWGESRVTKSKLQAMVKERLRLQMEDSAQQMFGMAGMTLADVQHFGCYDASTMHLVNQVEGFGFTPPGTGFDFCKDGQMGIDGRMPTNTDGGNLSGSYMHGWSQVVEAVRQLRGEAGPRQVRDARVAMTSLVQTDQSHPILYVRGDA